METPKVRIMVWWVLLLGILPGAVNGQGRLVEPRVTTLLPTYRTWSFSDPIATDSIHVSEVSQLSIPISLSFSPSSSWRIDLSGAYTLGSVQVTTPSGEADRSLALDGPTDAKIRAVGRLFGERLWLTFGANLPMGLVSLSEEEAAALQVIGAPALRMRTPVLGRGTGYTAGTVFTGVVGSWAIGLGASYELRSTYTPLEGRFAGAAGTVVDLSPGGTFHLSLAMDRTVGRGRMSFLAVGDRYSIDDVAVHQGAGGPLSRTNYRLGPALGLFWSYEVASGKLRKLDLSAAARYRGEFEDEAGNRVAESAASSFDLRAEATIGRPGSVGFLLGASGAFDSGSGFDESLATAAMAAGTLTAGLDFSTRRHFFRPFVAGSLGTVDSGPATSRGFALSAGCTLGTVW